MISSVSIYLNLARQQKKKQPDSKLCQENYGTTSSLCGQRWANITKTKYAFWECLYLRIYSVTTIHSSWFEHNHTKYTNWFDINYMQYIKSMYVCTTIVYIISYMLNINICKLWAGIILGVGSANERRSYNVTSSLIGWEPAYRMIPVWDLTNNITDQYQGKQTAGDSFNT